MATLAPAAFLLWLLATYMATKEMLPSPYGLWGSAHIRCACSTCCVFEWQLVAGARCWWWWWWQ